MFFLGITQSVDSLRLVIMALLII